VKPRFYRIIEQAVEQGVRDGWRRAYKHTDSPHEDAVKSYIEDAVMSALCDYFTFDESEYS